MLEAVIYEHLGYEKQTLFYEEAEFSSHVVDIIMTDDLFMKAIQNYTGDSEAAVLAVHAGNDLICCTNFEEQIPALLMRVKRGKYLRNCWMNQF